MLGNSMRVGALLMAASFVSACNTLPDNAEGGGNPLVNIVRYGGTTVPEPMAEVIEDAPCPPVDIIAGGAAIRNYTSAQQTNANLRSQISIANVARDCVMTRDGDFRIQLGIEGRVLLGPRGAPGRYEAPVRIRIRTGSETFIDRVVRASATVEAGRTQANFIISEDDLRVPSRAGRNYLIEVGLVSGRR
ncbi:MAG: hypothetical protein ACXIVE_06960 [Salinarimonas sp.]